MSDTWTPYRIERLRELVAAGTSYAAIGEALGMSKNAVLGKAMRLGIGGRRRLISEPKPPAVITNPFPRVGHCVWPHGYPGEDGFHFCGESCRNPGKPYCAEHMARAYVPFVKRNAAEKAIERAAKFSGRAA